MDKPALVLYPSPAIGHLVSMVELGKLLLTRHNSLHIHILLTTPPYEVGKTTPYLDSAAAAAAGLPLTFHPLPVISTPLNPSSSAYPESLSFELLRLNIPNVRRAILSISHHYSLRALIFDLFCSSALDVATDLGIPGYAFISSGAGIAACFLYLPQLHRTITQSFKDLSVDLQLPGLPPIPSSDMVSPLQDRNDKAYEWFLDASIKLGKAAGIVVNTFEALEIRAVKAVSDGICVADGPTPPIFCVGPIIAAHDHGGREGEWLRWLESQPSQSVVFLCFGSLGVFSRDQLWEIALGLERSGTRFLWVVRTPPAGEGPRTTSSPEPDLEWLLPAGFLERTQGRGLVVRSWAPQVAVGGFVMHCGWNSVLEAICAGVPMVAWPLYAEQRFNRVLMVEEMKVALRMEESGKGWVSAAEVERRVRELMETAEGRAVRERVLAMKDAAEAARSDGGSSGMAVSRLVESWIPK